MRIAVCDDDRHDREQVLQALRDAEPDAVAECFSDGASLLEAAKRTPPFDIIFLDIKINRGVIVNMDCIEEMRPDRFILQNGQELFLAVRERGAITAAYQDYLLDRVSRNKREAGL